MEQIGDVLICDLWQNMTDIFHDISVVNIYAKSHLTNTPEKCLQDAEWVNKKMYLEACLQQRRNFSTFVASVNGLLGLFWV